MLASDIVLIGAIISVVIVAYVSLVLFERPMRGIISNALGAKRSIKGAPTIP